MAGLDSMEIVLFTPVTYVVDGTVIENYEDNYLFLFVAGIIGSYEFIVV